MGQFIGGRFILGFGGKLDQRLIFINEGQG
jgi:hypothetical protein